MQQTEPLSEREREILKLVATGASNKEIATQLNISSNTVKVHLRNIFAKTGVVSRTEATLYAIRAGVADMPGQPVKEPEQIVAAPDATAAMVAPQRLVLDRRLYLGTALMFLLLAAILIYGITTLRQPAPIASASPVSPGALPRWQQKAPLPTARSGLALALYENQIYAIAGNSDQGVVSTTERYDPAANSWTSLAPKPVPVTDASAVVIGGKIYVAGGILASGTVTDTCDVYDPRQNRWEARAPLPKALSGYSLVAFEGKLYVFGGWDGQTVQASVYEYDPTLDTWKTKTGMPTARTRAGAAISGTKIYIIGGSDGNDALSINEEYTPDADDGSDNPWKQRAAIPSPRYGMGTTSVTGNIYVLGGEKEAQNTLTLLEYMPQQDKWQAFDSPLGGQWSSFAIIPTDTYIYVMGGAVNGTPTAQNWSFQAVYAVFLPVIR